MSTPAVGAPSLVPAAPEPCAAAPRALRRTQPPGAADALRPSLPVASTASTADADAARWADDPHPDVPARRLRAIFVSDVHLGTAGCKAEALLDFLRHHESEWLYLVGDVFDGWRLRKRWYWQQSHNDVVQKILRRARKGTRVVYVPGNHDEAARQFCGLAFGGVDVVEEAVHVTADGRRLWVVHGDLFDGVMRHARWLALLGDSLYTFTLWLNLHFNRARHRLGFGYWSLSAYLKGRVKNAVKFVVDFEDSLAAEARRRGFDGVVCGHIHKAEIREIDGILYCNDGDWVESLTALVETEDGTLSIVHWPAAGVDAAAPAPPAATPPELPIERERAGAA